MRELGRELGGLVGLVVDVIRRCVIRDPREGGDGFDLQDISRYQLISRIAWKSSDTLAVTTEVGEK
jgi:hypothetical protein